ncbi:MAG TPA: ferric reductase-like transmembrane domain-containing protein [Acidimicrobiia bacterium]|nr:ferric reductase-like transmembrane domain-containing protein [Acidimicrobiia bacterium]
MNVWWDAARSSGVVAWMVLAFSVLWGLALSTKVLGSRPRPSWLLDLHRYLGGLAVVFTAVHVGAVLVDQYVHFSIVNALVPFTGSWHPAAMAWGIVSLYLLLAVEITSLLRHRLSKRAWRAVHFLSFPLFVTATIHGLTVGTDRHALLLRAALVVVAVVIGLLTAVRFADVPVNDSERAHDVLSSARPSSGKADGRAARSFAQRARSKDARVS